MKTETIYDVNEDRARYFVFRSGGQLESKPGVGFFMPKWEAIAFARELAATDGNEKLPFYVSMLIDSYWAETDMVRFFHRTEFTR